MFSILSNLHNCYWHPNVSFFLHWLGNKGLCDLEGFESWHLHEAKHMLPWPLLDELENSLGDSCSTQSKDSRSDIDSDALLPALNKSSSILKHHWVYTKLACWVNTIYTSSRHHSHLFPCNGSLLAMYIGCSMNISHFFVKKWTATIFHVQGESSMTQPADGQPWSSTPRKSSGTQRCCVEIPSVQGNKWQMTVTNDRDGQWETMTSGNDWGSWWEPGSSQSRETSQWQRLPSMIALVQGKQLTEVGSGVITLC